MLPAIVSQPPPTIHGPQPPTSVTAAALGSSTSAFAASSKRPTSSPAQAVIGVGSRMSRAARPRPAEHNGDDSGNGGENRREAFQKRVGRFHLQTLGALIGVSGSDQTLGA